MCLTILYGSLWWWTLFFRLAKTDHFPLYQNIDFILLSPHPAAHAREHPRAHGSVTARPWILLNDGNPSWKWTTNRIWGNWREYTRGTVFSIYQPLVLTIESVCFARDWSIMSGRKQSAAVWSFFEYIEHKSKSKCLECGFKVTGKNSTNMRTHLKRHGELYKKCCDMETEIKKDR